MATQVDHLIVADNLSADGTREILDALAAELPLTVIDDHEPAHFQARKVTELAWRARGMGATWVVPADIDEVWYSPFGRLADVLAAVPSDHWIARAALYDHVATARDDAAETDPIARIGWRRVAPAALPKVACRTAPDLRILDGNHGALYDGPVLVFEGQLVVRHFPYRSAEQMAAKARMGAAALALTDLPEQTGRHWRDYGRLIDAFGEGAIHDVFRAHFHARQPEDDPGLIFDPVVQRCA